MGRVEVGHREAPAVRVEAHLARPRRGGRPRAHEVEAGPGPELDAGLSYGQLALAHTVVEVMRGTAELRADLPHIRSLYPLLADLLAGSALLPELPHEPPTAFLRLCRSHEFRS